MKILGMIKDWSDLNGPGYYRAFLPLRELERQAEDISVECFDVSAMMNMDDETLGGRDVYYMVRMYHADAHLFVAEVHRRGGQVVLDCDDDLTETYRLVSGHGTDFQIALAAVDWVTVSTQPLADFLGEFTRRPPVVIPNQIDTEWFIETAAKVPSRDFEGLTIGFAGTSTHHGDWMQAALALRQIADDDRVYPLLLGNMPKYMNYLTTGKHRIRAVPFHLYPMFLKMFEILLCAVNVNDHFNDGKSGIKAIEAMTLGVVPICSQFPPYQALADAGAPVVIVEEESVMGWAQAIFDLKQDTERRLFLGLAGPEWVKAHRDIKYDNWRNWDHFFRGVVADSKFQGLDPAS